MRDLMERLSCTYPIKNLSMIVACDVDGTIGKGNGLPWKRIKGDLPRFKQMTIGKVVIMGRKTFETLPEPLEGRYHIVLSRFWSIEDRAKLNVKVACSRASGIDFVTSINEIKEVLKYEPEEVFVVGGAEVYNLLSPYLNTVYITRIPIKVSGDTRVDWIAKKGMEKLKKVFRCESFEVTKDPIYGENHFYTFKRRESYVLFNRIKKRLEDMKFFIITRGKQL